MILGQGRDKPREPGEESRRAVGPTVPLGTGESALLTAAVMLTIIVVGSLLSGGFFSFPDLFVRKVSSRPPVHQPLPDLCTVFAGESPARLTMSPVADSRDMDRNAVKCRLEATDRSRSTHPWVTLEAVRPDAVRISLAGDDELKAARRHYRADSQPLDGRARMRPVRGLGDEAKIASIAGGEDTDAEVVVRSGLVQVNVRYRESAYVENVHPVSAPEAEQIVRTLAAELLKCIPPG